MCKPDADCLKYCQDLDSSSKCESIGHTLIGQNKIQSAGIHQSARQRVKKGNIWRGEVVYLVVRSKKKGRDPWHCFFERTDCTRDKDKMREY